MTKGYCRRLLAATLAALLVVAPVTATPGRWAKCWAKPPWRACSGKTSKTMRPRWRDR